MQERDRALHMVAGLQRESRVARLHELQAQMGVLRDEVANQMALRKGAVEELRRTVAAGGAAAASPFSSTTRPMSGTAAASSAPL
jgi:hypothetical protein